MRRFVYVLGAALLLLLGPAQSQPSASDTLPATNLSADPGLTPAEVADVRLADVAPGFSWAFPASNPQAPDAKAIGQATCTSCHTLETEHFAHTTHALGMEVAARANPMAATCEACHGAGSEHAAAPTTPGKIIAFLAGLVAASLPVTGLLIWWGRRAGKRPGE